MTTPSKHPAAWSRFTLAAIVCLWLITVGNINLWQTLAALPGVAGARGLWFGVVFGVGIAGATFALLALSAWRGVFQLVAAFFLISAAASSHFMLSYGIVIDTSMLANVVATDAREAADLMTWRMIAFLSAVGVLPALWVVTRRVTPAPLFRRLWQNSLAAFLGLAVAVLSALWVFQDLASVMRNHKEVRYMINPLNGVYAAINLAAQQLPQHRKPLAVIGEDAALGTSYNAGARPLRLVLVVGETSRAANWQLGGYARATNPELSALAARGEVQYYRDVMSCGTNTATSLPCMFSALGRGDYSPSNGPSEGLLDVLQRAGLAVLWIDNQSGCKGACDRVPNVNTRAATHPELCLTGECFDAVMLDDIDARINALPQAQRDKGVVLVMHQMGSHGPAYFKRTPDAFKDFRPECESAALQSCELSSLINAYDNTVRYTDHLLASAIAWLSEQSESDAALWYVSDHGESLGENNLFLHGLPYSLAPIEQKHVPQISWLSGNMQTRLGLTAACLQAKAGEPYSHDNLFHTLLGLADVSTALYQPQLDITASCRQAPQ